MEKIWGMLLKMCDHYVAPGTPHYCSDMADFDFGSYSASPLESMAGSYVNGGNC